MIQGVRCISTENVRAVEKRMKTGTVVDPDDIAVEV